MSPIPEHLSALKPGTLRAAQTYFRAQKQCSGAFCFRKLSRPFSCPTLSSPTAIRKEVEKKQLPFPSSQSSGAIFRKALGSSPPPPLPPVALPVALTLALLKANLPLQGKPPQKPPSPGRSKAPPECLGQWPDPTSPGLRPPPPALSSPPPACPSLRLPHSDASS